MQIQRLPPGTTSRTARVMLQLAHEGKGRYEIRQLAENITRHVAARDQMSEVLALYRYIGSRVRYLNDPHGIELVRDPIAGLQSGQLDCDDAAVLLGALCLAIGRDVKMVTVGFGGPRSPHSHTFPSVLVGNRWVVLDLVAGKRTRQMLSDVRGARFFG